MVDVTNAGTTTPNHHPTKHGFTKYSNNDTHVPVHTTFKTCTHIIQVLNLVRWSHHHMQATEQTSWPDGFIVHTLSLQQGLVPALSVNLSMMFLCPQECCSSVASNQSGYVSPTYLACWLNLTTSWSVGHVWSSQDEKCSFFGYGRMLQGDVRVFYARMLLRDIFWLFVD